MTPLQLSAACEFPVCGEASIPRQCNKIIIGCHLLTHCHFNNVDALHFPISLLITSIILLFLMNLQQRDSETCSPLTVHTHASSSCTLQDSYLVSRN